MMIFGLTGNTGTGKSTVADALRRQGIPVVDADRIAREIVERGQEALEEIVETFGPEYVDETGALRRQELGRLIFGDPTAKAKLEAITHPRIALRAQQELRRHEAESAPIAVYDSAILVETGLARAFAGLIVVRADRRQQIERIIARDGLSPADARQRVDAQMDLAEKVRLADYVVDNAGTLRDLEREIPALIEWMQERARAAGERVS